MSHRYLLPALTLIAAIIGFVFLISGQVNSAFAAKPQEVVKWSNGFPSGPHFNLNIHGKKDGFFCDGSSGGGSVFVPEYGDSEIHYLQNKKSSVSELNVLDKCGTFDSDPALVQLPKGEYQVYARILAKPQKSEEPREVIFYPKLVEACNDTGDPDFGDEVNCDSSFLLGGGIITSNGVFDLDSQELTRTKGRSKAVNVTELFQWTGFACDQAYDTDGDGEITTADLSTDDLDGDGFMDGDLNQDGVIDDADLAIYLLNNCASFESEWVFNIADLVVSGWDYKNNGSKLVQVRFYPVATTQFTQ